MTSIDASSPVAEPFVGRYADYILKYKPQPTPDGRYLAYAIVSCDLGVIQTIASVTPDLPSFATQDEAAGAGWAAGRKWVDSNSTDPFARDATRRPHLRCNVHARSR